MVDGVWATIFEGTVETTEDNLKYKTASLQTNRAMFEDSVCRVSINGETVYMGGILSDFGLWGDVGNLYLCDSTSDESVDTGEDWAVRIYYTAWRFIVLYSRVPGTYNLKVDKLIQIPKIGFLSGLVCSFAARATPAIESSIPWLIDFEYIENKDGTYTITGWHGTLNGVSSTRCVIPDNPLVVLNLDGDE